METIRETYFKMVRGGLSEEATFLLRPKDEGKVLSAYSKGRGSVASGGTGVCKGPEARKGIVCPTSGSKWV